MKNTAIYVELKFLNGNRQLVPTSMIDEIYDVYEKTRWLLCFKLAFPFIAFKKKTYVKFRHRTHYEYINSPLDPTFRVECSIMQFAKMFSLNVKQFEKSCVDADLS